MPDPAKKPRRRQPRSLGREERTQALRQAIVDSAIAEFAALGYGGASLRSISARTGIELGHLGYHFSTKMELWQAAVASIFDAMPKPADQPVAETPAEARATVARLIADYASFCLSHPEHIQIVFSEAAAGGERMDWITRHYLNDIVSGFSHHIEAVHRQGVLKTIEPAIFISALVGISAINFALPPLRDVLMGGGIGADALAKLLSTLVEGPGE
ncbi:TetR/AcrR family transcriptional regulator [Zavarzinia compransoris]|uniref:HTH tetR-type domain-containing protein n=1 Tax=Zavarzinia compransoris TaxID=1264899 RepID=A0A317EA51_9PROT|nr:TetR family transcriptional regulator [Zavarzinia compransoris]PWR23997.1 hypothetical protein DKG75_05500 [Zavarzinia compransoris]TDP48257.1 TetR family transcriptional regulator [Zavarzinia compransoris]